MTDLKIKTAEDLANHVRERHLNFVKVGVFDVDGVLRGKYMGRDKFLSSLEKGYGFCDVVLGWDSNDQLYDNVALTGWHTAYPDAAVRLLPETTRLLPFENDLPLVLSEFAGAHEGVCPRGTLRRVLKRARDMGYDVQSAVEYEFFLFEETPIQYAKSTIATSGTSPPDSSAIRCCVQRFMPNSITSCSTLAAQWTWSLRACIPKLAPACSKPPSK
jgi:glutamine synthetase